MTEHRSGLPEVIQRWLDLDRGETSEADRLRILEDIVAFWVPVSTERDLRLATIEDRLAALEAANIPDAYPCVAELIDRVATLEATVWELRRRLKL